MTDLDACIASADRARHDAEIDRISQTMRELVELMRTQPAKRRLGVGLPPSEWAWVEDYISRLAHSLTPHARALRPDLFEGE